MQRATVSSNNNVHSNLLRRGSIAPPVTETTTNSTSIDIARVDGQRPAITPTQRLSEPSDGSHIREVSSKASRLLAPRYEHGEICQASAQITVLMTDEQSYQLLTNTWDPICLYSNAEMASHVADQLKREDIIDPCQKELYSDVTVACDEVLDYWSQVEEVIPTFSGRLVPDNSCDFSYALRDFDQFFKSIIQFGGRTLADRCVNSTETAPDPRVSDGDLCQTSLRIQAIMRDEQSYQMLRDIWDPECLYPNSVMAGNIADKLEAMELVDPCQQPFVDNETVACDEIMDYWAQVVDEIPAMSQRLVPDNGCNFEWALRDFDQLFISIIHFAGQPLLNACRHSTGISDFVLPPEIGDVPPREIPQSSADGPDIAYIVIMLSLSLAMIASIKTAMHFSPTSRRVHAVTSHTVNDF